MLISYRQKFIYIKNKKVAGSSVESVFQRYCLPEDEENSYENYGDEVPTKISEAGVISGRLAGVMEGQVWTPHLSATEIKQEVGNQIFDEYFKFSVIRNPFDKVVSSFWFYHMGSPWMHNGDSERADFQEIKSMFCSFVNTMEKESLDWRIHTIDGTPICDLYIRFEDLIAGVGEAFRELNVSLEPLLLPRFKSVDRKGYTDYRLYYDNNSLSIVENVYRRELECFGYKFD